MLVGAGCLLLVGVGGHERRVEVEGDAAGCAGKLPDTSTRFCPRPPDRLQARRVEGGERPPGGRIRGDAAEQGRLGAQRAQVGQTVTAVGEHDREVAQRPARVVARAALTHVPDRLRDRPGQTDPVGEPDEQCGACPRGQAVGIRHDL